MPGDMSVQGDSLYEDEDDALLIPVSTTPRRRTVRGATATDSDDVALSDLRERDDAPSSLWVSCITISIFILAVGNGGVTCVMGVLWVERVPRSAHGHGDIHVGPTTVALVFCPVEGSTHQC